MSQSPLHRRTGIRRRIQAAIACVGASCIGPESAMAIPLPAMPEASVLGRTPEWHADWRVSPSPDAADADVGQRDAVSLVLMTAGLAAMTLAAALAMGGGVRVGRWDGTRRCGMERHRGTRGRDDMNAEGLDRDDRGANIETMPAEPCRAISVIVTSAPDAVPPRPQAPQPVETPRQPALEAIARTRSAYSHQAWGSFDRDAVPKLLFYGGNRFRQFTVDALDAADEWFVIGDIHGDFFALHTIISHVRAACPGFGIIFLGDLIDRGPHPIECLWYLLKLADDLPGRVLWLAGNHDVGVVYDESAGMFRSTVQPAEFVSDLNVVDSFSPLRRAFGREYIELARGLPRAAVMPDGLLLTHGGFPHTDLQGELSRLPRGNARSRWLESDEVLRDFTHLRITRYPTRRPNRLSISCSYGYRDFESFRRSLDGYGIRRLVTGHQHCAAGYDDHPEWAEHGAEALTLTGFGFADDHDRPESYGPGYRRELVVGRCRPDRIPEVVKIPVDEAELAAFHRVEIATLPRFAAVRQPAAGPSSEDRAVVGTA